MKVILKHITCIFTEPHPKSIKQRLILTWGKFRRLFQISFQKSKVEKALKYRRGECIRCGWCCHMVYKCPSLSFDENGLACCDIHEHKPPNCLWYPVYPVDIEDRDRLSPPVKCGYWFDYTKNSEEDADLDAP